MSDALFDEWRVYEKLLIHDYMDHRAFFGRLATEIRTRFERPIALLDLGCGDLTPILPLLRDTPLRSYTGVDESNMALSIARERLAESGIDGQLVPGDLRAVLRTLEGPFDVIVASFSLHHLQDPQEKQATFAACGRVLGPDGFLALIDVFSNPSETRNDYVERWIGHADQRYAALAPGEKQLLFDHVRARDYPVSLDHCRALGQAAGLSGFEVLHEDAPLLNRLVTLSPSPRPHAPA